MVAFTFLQTEYIFSSSKIKASFIFYSNYLKELLVNNQLNSLM